MRETITNAITNIYFICGGLEYKVQVQCAYRGKCLMVWSVIKIWAMGANKRYVRICPYDMETWCNGMETDIEKAIKEELL